MADNSALYGLLGALGGAAITSLAAFYGPLRLHRRQARQRQDEERALRKEAELDRLLRMRSTGRGWLDALERTVQDLEAGRAPDVDRFDEDIRELSREGTEAAYSLAHSGIWLASTPPPPWRATAEADPPEASPPSGALAAEARSHLLDCLRRASREVRTDVLRHSLERGPGSSVRPEVLAALDRVREAREHLNATLLDRIEEVNGGPAQQL
ncbi:hypothetical protein ACH429_02900 [Streptomyces pathocidini]|uniref:Uncharacterized protein n=1 Tax=Streptomyces pathocidini TaxID=1650571 RepID=A0ABW7UK88_9ACTN|nr:hypothetical protein [Streptomyces pathocidini]